MKWSALDFCHSRWLSTTVRDFSKRNRERAHAGITESRGSGEGHLPSAASSSSPSDFVMKRVRAGIMQRHSERAGREHERLKQTEREIRGDWQCVHCDLVPRARERSEAPAAAEQSRPEGPMAEPLVCPASIPVSLWGSRDTPEHGPGPGPAGTVTHGCHSHGGAVPSHTSPPQVLPASACSGPGNFFGAAGVARLLLVPFCC